MTTQTLAERIRADLDRAGPSRLDAVFAALATIEGEGEAPGCFATALPLVEEIVREPGPEARRIGALLLLARMYQRLRPELLPPSAFASFDEKKAREAEWAARERGTFLALAADPATEVAVQAALVLLAEADRAQAAALRPRLAHLVPELERRAATDADAARALLRLEGGRRAAIWLADLADGKRAPLDVLPLATELRSDPVPESLDTLCRLLLAQPAVAADRGPIARIFGGLFRMGDEDTTKVDILFEDIARLDPARAKELLDRVGAKMRPHLAARLAELA